MPCDSNNHSDRHDIYIYFLFGFSSSGAENDYFRLFVLTKAKLSLLYIGQIKRKILIFLLHIFRLNFWEIDLVFL